MPRQVLRLAALGTAAGLLVVALHGSASAFNNIGVPEIDPGTLGSGVAILTGAALVLIERFRRR